MTTKNVSVKIDELKTSNSLIKNLQVSIGKVVDQNYAEPMGPTPMPSLTALRDWDMKLLTKYKPFYMPDCDLCCLCTFGKCDLTSGKRGACGLDIGAQSSRIVLLACCIGAATHTAHSRHMVHHLIEKYGSRYPLDIGGLNIKVEAPITRLVTGIKPETLGDLETVLEYAEEQITQAIAVAHTGQEGNNLDFESKAFHVGMIDHLGMEVGDIAQVSTLGFPKAEPEAPLVQLGIGSVDISKPVIMCIGHNVIPSVGIIDYAKDHKVDDKIEVVGLCCTAHDITRYYNRGRIVGPISWQLRFIRAGFADVVVLDEQCVRTDAFDEARKVHAPVIAASEKNCMGFKNRTEDSADEIVFDLVSGKVPGVLILDPELVGEVAVRVAQQVAPLRKKMKNLPSLGEIKQLAKTCRQCNMCRRSCPQDLKIPQALKAAAEGDLVPLTDLYEYCVGCGRCEEVCPVKLNVHSFILKAGEKFMMEESNLCRIGRGAVQDVEIRNVGSPIVLGEIPGILAVVGCSNYPKGGKDVYDICREFASRRYIVVTSGCAAMTAGSYRNSEGKTLYEEFPGGFEAGGVLNVGSCVANSHIAGAAIKVANIFAKRNLRGNYEEIADYIYNRLGAVGLAWGAYSQKAAAIAAGFWRLGIPVLVGPHGSKYRRMLLGREDKPENWEVYDARTGNKVNVGPAPEHLFQTVETPQEAMVSIAKLCIRPNDTWKGRSIKLSHYVDLHKRYYGCMPQDLHLFVRTLADVPVTLRDEFGKILEAHDWKETVIPDPTLLPRMIRKVKD
ncbi:MAG TPA: CO dehydrogenase/acetyl-CoA synthase complex subunit alpha [Candidatus Limnocylindrales bacterium]|nr:CO dehydrogenase/acetyl-CoA synthase complex subunit alpha [Candidatus Limnocylindrales bacterium]